MTDEKLGGAVLEGAQPEDRSGEQTIEEFMNEAQSKAKDLWRRFGDYMSKSGAENNSNSGLWHARQNEGEPFKGTDVLKHVVQTGQGDKVEYIITDLEPGYFGIAKVVLPEQSDNPEHSKPSEVIEIRTYENGNTHGNVYEPSGQYASKQESLGDDDIKRVVNHVINNLEKTIEDRESGRVESLGQRLDRILAAGEVPQPGEPGPDQVSPVEQS